MTILNTIEARTMPVWLGFIFLSCVSFTVMLAKLAYDENDMIGFALTVIITLALSAASIYIFYWGKDVQRVYATIDDTKPFVEVMEEYTIYDRQGDIWVLDKPKEANMTNDTPATAKIYWSIPEHQMERTRCILCGAELYRVKCPICDFCAEALKEGRQ